MNTIDAKKFYNEVMPNKQGDDYEVARWHNTPIASVGYEQTNAAIRKYLPSTLQPASILEIGPGAGTWTKVLVEKYPETLMTLLDISREMLDRARTALGDDRIMYIESAFDDFTSNEQFELIFSSRMLEYMEDKETFAAKVADLLTSGGSAVLTTKLPHYTRLRLQGKRVSNFHTGQIAPVRLGQLLEKNGLKVQTIAAVTVNVPVFKSAKLNRLAGKLIGRLPLNPVTNTCVESYLIVATKP